MAFSFDLSYVFLSSPYNVILQGLLAIVIAYFFLRRGGKDNKAEQPKLRDVDEFIAEWTPEPLPTQLSSSQKRNLKEFIISQAGITRATVNGKANVLHAARCNYLGLSGSSQINKVGEETMRKYGVGSCGPRGFYGTIDAHIFLERRIAKFLETEDAILYSSNFCTTSSAIPAFSKRGDIIICDKGVNHAIQVGCILSRSTVHFFNHNDLADLERVLIETMPKQPSNLVRKFLVVEGLYYNYGDLCPLKEIMAMKEKYKFRLVLDESHSVCTLGATGRGVTELLGVDHRDIELLTGNLGHGFAAGGGFCASTASIVYHQRLNGSGYVFSASLPPFLSACAEAAINILDSTPALVSELANNVKLFHTLWHKREKLRTGADAGDLGLAITSASESPVIHLRLTPSHQTKTRDEEEDILEAICDHALGHSGVFITRAKYIDNEKFLPPPSIRICMSTAFETKDVEQIVDAVCAAVEATM
jgi:serine palmitoyltransferase